MASARTVAVVVPSPATSLVLEATSLTMRAPMFSYLSSSSISLATVTPSLVTVGEPKLFWRMTFRPLGPSVTLTALASFAMPRRIASRASWSNAICFAAILSPLVSRKYHDLCAVPASPQRQARANFRLALAWRCGLAGRKSLQHRQHILLAHQEDVVARALLELVAGPVGEQHHVAFLDGHRGALAFLVE